MLCSSQGHSALGSEIRIESRQKTLGYHHYIVLYSQVYLIHLGTEIDVLFPFPTVLSPLQLIFNVYKSSLSTSI